MRLEQTRVRIPPRSQNFSIMNRKERVEKDSLTILGVVAIILFILVGLGSVL